MDVIEEITAAARASRLYCKATRDREHRVSVGRHPALLVYRVICADEDTMQWPEEGIGNLRVALNALVSLFTL